MHVECRVDRLTDDGYTQRFDHWAPCTIGSDEVIAKHLVPVLCIPISECDFYTIPMVDVADVFVAEPNLCAAFRSLVDQDRFQEALR